MAGDGGDADNFPAKNTKKFSVETYFNGRAPMISRYYQGVCSAGGRAHTSFQRQMKFSLSVENELFWPSSRMISRYCQGGRSAGVGLRQVFSKRKKKFIKCKYLIILAELKNDLKILPRSVLGGGGGHRQVFSKKRGTVL